MDAKIWYKELLSALGKANEFSPNADEPICVLTDDRGRERLIIELSPRETHINLYAPFLDYGHDTSVEIAAYTSRKLLEFNADSDELVDLVLCADHAREQYLLRGKVALGAAVGHFIDVCSRLVDRGAELEHYFKSEDAFDGSREKGENLMKSDGFAIKA